MINIAKPYLTKDEAQTAYETIMSGWVTQGPRVQEFEENFAKYVGAKYAVAVSSCTTALHLALIAAGIKPGDEVICPSLSYIATSNSIIYTGAKPIFGEINSTTYNLDAAKVEKYISPKTKAILLVHQIGMPADIDAFKLICKKHKLILIEDAACAIGSKYKNKKIGTHSDLVCFSFHPRKVITTGDGGMIITSNKKYYKNLQLLRQHGMSVNDRVRHTSNKVIIEEYSIIGYNYRMTDIQASVGIEQLKKLDWLIQERRKIAQKYNEAFKDINCIQLPFDNKNFFSNYQSYMIYIKKNTLISRNDLMQKMLEAGIATRRGIMTSHREVAYKNLYGKIKLPITENVSDNCIILPLYVPMKKEDINYVIKTFKKLLS